MVGGEQGAFDRAKPVIDSYARACVLMGAVGSGQLAKMVNQICIAGLLQGLSEGMNFATKAGLDCAKLVEVISKGAAQSWQMENRAHTMVEGKFNFGFAVDWMRKDLGICLAEAKRNRRPAAGHRAGRPVLRPGAGARRQPLGYLEPDPPAGERLRVRAPANSGLPPRLDLLPERLQRIQADVRRDCGPPRQARLDLAEAALELGVRMAKRSLGIDIEMAGEIDDGKQQVADFVLDPLRWAAAVHF